MKLDMRWERSTKRLISPTQGKEPLNRNKWAISPRVRLRRTDPRRMITEPKSCDPDVSM